MKQKDQSINDIGREIRQLGTIVKENTIDIRRLGVMVEEVDRRLGVMIEGVDDRVGLLAEQYGSIRQTLDHHTEILDSHTEMIGNLTVDMHIVKEDVQSLKNDVKQKVDADGFSGLEKRVSILEKKR